MIVCICTMSLGDKGWKKTGCASEYKAYIVVPVHNHVFRMFSQPKLKVFFYLPDTIYSDLTLCHLFALVKPDPIKCKSNIFTGLFNHRNF